VAPRPAAAQDLDLVNVTLVDGTGAAPRKAVTVTVRDGKIASIVERAPQPASGVRRIDFGGRCPDWSTRTRISNRLPLRCARCSPA